jgi:hypothetical protein
MSGPAAAFILSSHGGEVKEKTRKGVGKFNYAESKVIANSSTRDFLLYNTINKRNCTTKAFNL